MQKTKRYWTRTEKWLLWAPLAVLLCAFGLTSGKEALRRRMGWPVRIIKVSSDGVPQSGTIDNYHLRLFAVSNDNKIAINRGENGPLCIYQLEKGEELARLDLNLSRLRGREAWDCSFLPDNKHIAVCSMSGPVEIWSIAENSSKRSVPAKSMRIALSPDGTRLVTSSYKVWNLSSNRLQHKLLKGFTEGSIVFSRDGKLVAMRVPADIQKDRTWKGGEVWIWQVDSGKLQAKMPALMADKFDFSPDDKQIVCIEHIYDKNSAGSVGYNLKLFDVQGKRKLWKHTTGPNTERWRTALFSPDRRWIVVSTWNDFVELRDPETGALKATLRGGWRDGNIDNALMGGSNLRFTRDGKFLVLRARQEIRIWDMNEVNARFGSGK